MATYSHIIACNWEISLDYLEVGITGLKLKDHPIFDLSACETNSC
jgi:hypothetical protein